MSIKNNTVHKVLPKVVVTGANGFVGKGLVHALLESSEYEIFSVVRKIPSDDAHPRNNYALIDDLSATTDWGLILSDADVVIHAAARVHVMSEESTDPLTEFRKINVDGTLNLARQALAAGVRRFVFISSIKVNGDGTQKNKPYTAEDQPAPSDPYGISKYEAELGLLDIANNSNMDVVIIRPPLIYGPGVKANFLNMMRWLYRGIPLPFGAIHNRRSLVALENVVDLVITCIDHRNASNQIFLVSDGHDLSTTDLLRLVAKALSKTPRLLPVPSGFLSFFANVFGKKSLSQRLCGSLQIDISKTQNLLGWAPPFKVDEALSKTVAHFMENQRK